MPKGKKYAEELSAALEKANPVLSFEDTFRGIPYEKIHERPDGLPYSIWDLTTHLRIAQHTYLHTAKDPGFKSPKWPEEFWPKEQNPSETEWNHCLREIHSDGEQWKKLIIEKEEKIFDPLAHAGGASVFDLALKSARHSSYHAGEIVVLRRLLGIWKK